MSNMAAKRAADDDLDSPMQEDSSAASSPATPPNAAPPSHFTSELSPPDSQQLAAQNPASAPSPFTPLGAATGSKAAANTSKKMPPSDKVNANGKRNWELNAGGNASNGGQAAQLEKIGKDDASGYTWEREEDAPGWQWGNPKAREEAQRAWAGVFGKDRSVGNKYGDVLLK